MKVIGIDPGKNGGIAVLRSDGPPLVVRMPETEADIFETISNWSAVKPVHAFIEKVASSPQQGVVSAFTFGRGLGHLEMALTAARVPFTYVSPVTWQRKLQCLSKGDKNVTKRRAQQLFPDIQMTHWKADALLIAKYGLSTLD